MLILWLVLIDLEEAGSNVCVLLNICIIHLYIFTLADIQEDSDLHGCQEVSLLPQYTVDPKGGTLISFNDRWQASNTSTFTSNGIECVITNLAVVYRSYQLE